MSLSKSAFSSYIKQFQFRELFNDMGWNNDRTSVPIVVDNETYHLQSVAEKSGFKILTCTPPNGNIADYNIRKKIETKVTRLFQEHLIIFCDTLKTQQIWQVVLRQTGKPSKVTETRWYVHQDPELLYERASGIFFELDEEEHITIVDVTQRVAGNFHQNNERVTKKFYAEFKQEHTSFLKFIKGISEKTNRDWYASLMLNRLMFCYFIQKKGFLDNNKNYLRDKLDACTLRQAQGAGKAKFYSFYRDFLLVLFHKGLNEPEKSKETQIEIGRIPYLNGGLFDEHELEKNYKYINIEDKAFERLFDFFDQYEWHLDTRKAATGKDINPDVIGYIFEKYINDRAQMGAYYTKEDITDYISKNCVLPFLFDETKRNYPKAFAHDGEIWKMVKQSEDRYIYDAVKKGVALALPEEIEIGVDTTKPKLIERRKEWNKPASEDYALPTEIWREVVDRRKRYNDVKNKIDNGNVQQINDFITYNLNIRQFAQDVIENTNDPEFLKHYYKSLNNVTILDPTCGSGAFLFAALNILEPLYEGCLQRMEIFLEEAKNEDNYKHLSPELQKSWKSINHEKSWFRQVLSQVNAPEHPNQQYFIYKSIILRNLYGVDIMKEAVEIAKLRLFLKLVATVETNYLKPNLGLEPLPDIDFNIRAGNTLMGFATEKELETGSLDFQSDKEKVLEEMEKVSMAFERFKAMQLSGEEIDHQDFKKAKEDYQKQLNKLKDKLNHSYYNVFGDHKKGFEKWMETSLPFHWFAEYYEQIYKHKGFDVIIGNPPYVVYTKKDSKTKLSIADKYKLKGYETLESNNLFSFVIERCQDILNENSMIGMIIPISSISSANFNSLQKIFAKNLLTWQSSYSNRPGKLFENVEQRLTIFIGNKHENKSQEYFSTSYKHWYANTREFLFPNICYVNQVYNNSEISFSKVGCALEIIIKGKVQKKSKIKLNNLSDNRAKHFVFYHNGPTYFIRAMSFMPNDGKDMEPSSHYKQICFRDDLRNVPTCILNSSLFYFFYKNYSNCRDFSEREIYAFPIGIISDDTLEKINEIEKRLRKSYKDNRELKNRAYNSGLIYYEEFYPAKSKPIIDEIDTVLAEHYGFTEEELDFIINYDIKYRMGRELEEDV